MTWRRSHRTNMVVFEYIPKHGEQREALIVGSGLDWTWSASVCNCLPMNGAALADGASVSPDSAKEDVLAWFHEMDEFLARAKDGEK